MRSVGIVCRLTLCRDYIWNTRLDSIHFANSRDLERSHFLAKTTESYDVIPAKFIRILKFTQRSSRNLSIEFHILNGYCFPFAYRVINICLNTHKRYYLIKSFNLMVGIPSPLALTWNPLSLVRRTGF